MTTQEQPQSIRSHLGSSGCFARLGGNTIKQTYLQGHASRHRGGSGVPRGHGVSGGVPRDRIGLTTDITVSRRFAFAALGPSSQDIGRVSRLGPKLRSVLRVRCCCAVFTLVRLGVIMRFAKWEIEVGLAS